MTQISIETQTNFEHDPAIEIWPKIIELPEIIFKKLGEIVLGQD